MKYKCITYQGRVILDTRLNSIQCVVVGTFNVYEMENGVTQFMALSKLLIWIRSKLELFIWFKHNTLLKIKCIIFSVSCYIEKEIFTSRPEEHIPCQDTVNSLIWTFLYHTPYKAYSPSPGNLGKVAPWYTDHLDRTRILVCAHPN